MSIFSDLIEVVITEVKLLCFMPVKPDLKRHRWHYLALGILTAWIAGIGRYWDNPRASHWQHLGIGSVLYLFILAGVIWCFMAPLRPRNWTYLNVLIFIGMTSPPAFLYAIPVEKYYSLETAQTINIWFLGIVALWRMVLLTLYLQRSGGLGKFESIVGMLCPIDLVIVSLTILNLQHAAFEMMGGIERSRQTPHDGVYEILILLTFLSVYAFPVLLGLYIFTIIRRKDQLKAEKASDSAVNPIISIHWEDK